VTLAANIGISLRTLHAHKLRSGLALLGIIFGVAAVVAMVAVGRGAQARVEAQIRSLGANVMVILSGTLFNVGAQMNIGSRPNMSESDAAALPRAVPTVLLAAPAVRGTAQAVYGSGNVSTALVGTTPDYLSARDWRLSRGRNFSDEELHGAAKVALIGETVARKLFQNGDPLDRIIRLEKVPVLVVGVLTRKGQSFTNIDQDDLIVVPLTTARKRILGAIQGYPTSVSSITLKVMEGVDPDRVTADIYSVFRQRHHTRAEQPDDVHVSNLSEVLRAKQTTSRILALLLAAIASVSLLVGGIGIMNVMLVSVAERTREIGLRIAVGARRRDILAQFLIEAVVLASIGGLAGLALGVVSSLSAGRLTGWPTDLRPDAILLAVGSASAVGIFFGYYPARRASKLSPIEALRRE
jgi:putative ABC transport system permease protein